MVIVAVPSGLLVLPVPMYSPVASSKIPYARPLSASCLERLLMLRLVDLLFDPDPETLLLRDFDPLLLVLLESLEDPLLDTLLLRDFDPLLLMLLESLEDPLLETLRLFFFDPLEEPLFPILLELEFASDRDLLFEEFRLREPEALLVLLFDPL
jgi:hypothetical protein